MSSPSVQGASSRMHPLHLIALAGMLPLFLGAMASDLAYAKTFEVQWTNFASWLIVAGLMFAGPVLLLAAVMAFGKNRNGSRGLLYLGLAAAIFVLGFVNSLVHAKDGWAAMPAALILSVITAVLVMLAVVLGFSARQHGDFA